MTSPALTALAFLSQTGTSCVVSDRWPSISSTKQLNSPEFGWEIAVRLAGWRRQCALIRRPEYRWVRAAVQLLKSEGKASRRLSDVKAVSAALALFQTDSARSMINACLLTAEVTISAMAKALLLPVEVIAAYSDLYFNVIDRRKDIGYIRGIVFGLGGGSLLTDPRSLPTDEETLLQVGFRGSIEDVFRVAGGTTETESPDMLSARLTQNMLAAADEWAANPGKRHQAIPPMADHGVDLVKRLKTEDRSEVSTQTGESIGDILRQQLEADVEVIRKGMALAAQRHVSQNHAS